MVNDSECLINNLFFLVDGTIQKTIGTVSSNQIVIKFVGNILDRKGQYTICGQIHYSGWGTVGFTTKAANWLIIDDNSG